MELLINQLFNCKILIDYKRRGFVKDVEKRESKNVLIGFDFAYFSQKWNGETDTKQNSNKK